MKKTENSPLKIENDSLKIYEVLMKVPGFQKNPSDELLIDMLKEEFPAIDLFEEAKKYLFWIIDQPEVDSGKKWNHRSRFRSWVKKASRSPYEKR